MRADHLFLTFVLAGLISFLLVSVPSIRADSAGPSKGRFKIVQSDWEEFSKGEFENLKVTRSGSVQLFVRNFFGNEFTAESRYTSSMSLDQPEKRISMRFAAGKTRKLVRLRVYLYQRGDVKNWRVRLEKDDGTENHLPSGELAWEGSESLVAPTETGWVTVPIDSGKLRKGRLYHVVLSPVGTPNAEDYVLPSSTEPLNREWVDGSLSNCKRSVLFSSSGGENWKRVEGREPVYVLDFSDGTHSGNPYYSYTSKGIKEKDFHGEKISPSSDLSVTAAEFYVKRTRDVPEDDLYLTIEGKDGSIAAGVENEVPVNDDYSWVRFEIPGTISLSEGENYRLYLSSPKSGEVGYYYVDYLNAFSDTPYPKLGYDGKNSYYISSDDSGLSWDSGKSEDLAFRLVVEYESRGEYRSRIFDAGTVVEWKEVRWNSEEPSKSNLSFYGRSSDNGDSWSSWSKCSNGEKIDIPNGRYFQYRVYLESSKDAVTPVLKDVSVSYGDASPPRIESLRPDDGNITASERPTVRGELEDDLSGVKPESVELKLENERVAPHFDPVSGEFWYSPEEKLGREKVNVRLEARDYAGNSVEREWMFSVKPSASTFSLDNSSGKDLKRVEYWPRPQNLTLGPVREGGGRREFCVSRGGGSYPEGYDRC